MKKIMKNRQGFTLIELLAVIVLLAIVGVVGANLIITRLNKGKVDTFVNDYRDIVKEVSAAQIDGMNYCNQEGTKVGTQAYEKCSDHIDYATNDIDLTVSMDDSSNTTVVVKANTTGTFKKIDLSKYYCDSSDATNKYSCSYVEKDAKGNKIKDNSDKTKLPKGATLTDKTIITGTFE